MEMVDQLQCNLREHLHVLLREGILDKEFTKLQKLQDGSCPNFVLDAIRLHYYEFDNLLRFANRLLQQPVVDFGLLRSLMHKQSGSSASIGARRVADACHKLKLFCNIEDLDGCKKCMRQLIDEYFLLKENLLYYFRMQKQIQAAGGSIPTMADPG